VSKTRTIDFSHRKTLGSWISFKIRIFFHFHINTLPWTSRKRLHTLGVRAIDSLHQITPIGVIFSLKKFSGFKILEKITKIPLCLETPYIFPMTISQYFRYYLKSSWLLLHLTIHKIACSFFVEVFWTDALLNRNPSKCFKSLLLELWKFTLQ
jgi:hypothetical protein